MALTKGTLRLPACLSAVLPEGSVPCVFGCILGQALRQTFDPLSMAIGWAATRWRKRWGGGLRRTGQSHRELSADACPF